jgi:hypothetical protein
MKKLVLVLLVSLSTLFGAEYTKEDRMNDMNEMAAAMNKIQSGFFYNNYDTVASGIDSLRNAVARVQPPAEEVEEEDLIAKYMNQKIQMTNKIVKKINKKSLTILERFKSGDSAQALQEYNKIMGQCMACHREMRNW